MILLNSDNNKFFVAKLFINSFAVFSITNLLTKFLAITESEDDRGVTLLSLNNLNKHSVINAVFVLDKKEALLPIICCCSETIEVIFLIYSL